MNVALGRQSAFSYVGTRQYADVRSAGSRHDSSWLHAVRVPWRAGTKWAGNQSATTPYNLLEDQDQT